jgi:hypothetical protein
MPDDRDLHADMQSAETSCWEAVMGVGEDFAKFKDNYQITQEMIGSISYRYKRITRQLNTDFRDNTSDTANSLYVGSYGRDTAAKGLSDLDMAFILPYAEYATYKAFATNGPSALLQAVKRSIQKTYPTSESFGDGQVVVITFDDGVRFEILPVFDNKDSDSWTYPNANGGGEWRVCNPRAEMKAVAKRSADTNKNLKYLGRMTRVWCAHCSVPMSGMLIDTLAYQFIETYVNRDKAFLYHDLMMRDFLEFLSQQPQTQTVWRAPGSGSHVGRTGIFEHKARSAQLRAIEAVNFDLAHQDWSRRQKWREVFGNLYPA